MIKLAIMFNYLNWAKKLSQKSIKKIYIINDLKDFDKKIISKPSNNYIKFLLNRMKNIPIITAL